MQKRSEVDETEIMKRKTAAEESGKSEKVEGLI